MSAVNDAHECLIVKLVHGCSKNEKIKSCVILQFVLTVENIKGIQGKHSNHEVLHVFQSVDS